MATTSTQGSAWQEAGNSGATNPDAGTMGRTGAMGNLGATGSDTGTSSRTGAMSENTTATVDKIASSAHQAVDRIASAASSAASQFGVKGDEMMEVKDRMLDTTREYVREKPFAALGIALAAGFILSRIL